MIKGQKGMLQWIRIHVQLRNLYIGVNSCFYRQLEEVDLGLVNSHTRLHAF